jgi:DnaK suppressor protein
MNQERARSLLDTERRRVEQLLAEMEVAGQEDRETANESGVLSDPAERLTAEETDDVIATELRARLNALARAEVRIKEGTFGFSVRSGRPIPDARLEADPAAELTLDEEERA